LKINKILIIFFALFVFLLNTAAEETTDTGLTETIEGVTLDVDERGVVRVTKEIKFTANSKTYSANIMIPQAKILEIRWFRGELNYNSMIASGEQMITINFPEPLNAGDTEIVTIKYLTEDLTSKQGSIWTLATKMSVSDESNVKVIFPGFNYNAKVFSIRVY